MEMVGAAKLAGLKILFEQVMDTPATCTWAAQPIAANGKGCNMPAVEWK